jgi:hypothetical protein
VIYSSTKLPQRPPIGLTASRFAESAAEHRGPGVWRSCRREPSPVRFARQNARFDVAPAVAPKAMTLVLNCFGAESPI